MLVEGEEGESFSSIKYILFNVSIDIVSQKQQ